MVLVLDWGNVFDKSLLMTSISCDVRAWEKERRNRKMIGVKVSFAIVEYGNDLRGCISFYLYSPTPPL